MVRIGAGFHNVRPLHRLAPDERAAVLPALQTVSDAAALVDDGRDLGARGPLVAEACRVALGGLCPTTDAATLAALDLAALLRAAGSIARLMLEEDGR